MFVVCAAKCALFVLLAVLLYPFEPFIYGGFAVLFAVLLGVLLGVRFLCCWFRRNQYPPKCPRNDPRAVPEAVNEADPEAVSRTQ